MIGASMDKDNLITQISSIIEKLHGLFDDIGIATHERESRESQLFMALSETLNHQLCLVTTEKNGITEEAHQIIKAIKQMEVSLEDQQCTDKYQPNGQDLKVTVPLLRCLQTLKEKHHNIAKVHRERFEQVQKLVEALESYSSHLESSFVQIALPPTTNGASVPLTFDLSPSYVAALDKEFSRVYEEYTRRVASVKAVSEDIVNLWAELGTPQAQTENSIVKYYRDAPEQLGLHEEDVNRLQTKRDRLIEEKRGRERKLKELKSTIEGLWDRLGVEEPDRKKFLAGNRGCGLRAINEFEAELDRLNELKRQNLHLFVEDARYKLQELWDGLYFSEEEMLEFTPAFSDVYSDALLSAHESEITRLEALKEQRAPTLQLINNHRSLIKDRDELAASSQDASRLLAKPTKGERRDPTRLLREEKMRKRIAKDLPKVEAEIKKILEQWENEYGRPFLVHGVRYLDELAASAPKTIPPRSKTPSVPATSAKLPKAAPSVSSSRAGSVMRALPPPHSSAKTPAGTLRSNPLGSSISTAGGRTPSKIPARIPLGTMQHGSNSPERRPVPSELVYDTGTMRKRGPPTRAPPPKMRDIFVRPTATPINEYDSENTRCASAASSNGSARIRQVVPEDVYDDRDCVHRPSASTSLEQNTPKNYRDFQATSQFDTRYRQDGRFVTTVDSRQISATSASTGGVSGSENWETFDDASEPEVDASEAYYAKARAANSCKRFVPEGGYAPPQGKKPKHMYSGTNISTTFSKRGPEHVVSAGSEAGWTDEDAF